MGSYGDYIPFSLRRTSSFLLHCIAIFNLKDCQLACRKYPGCGCFSYYKHLKLCNQANKQNFGLSSFLSSFYHHLLIFSLIKCLSGSQRLMVGAAQFRVIQYTVSSGTCPITENQMHKNRANETDTLNPPKAGSFDFRSFPNVALIYLNHIPLHTSTRIV